MAPPDKGPRRGEKDSGSRSSRRSPRGDRDSRGSRGPRGDGDSRGGGRGPRRDGDSRGGGRGPRRDGDSRSGGRGPRRDGDSRSGGRGPRRDGDSRGKRTRREDGRGKGYSRHDRSRGAGYRDRRGGYTKEGPARDRSNQTLKLVATCALGLELVVGRELEALGLGPIERHNAQVYFPYSPENLAKANYWLRSADRVWLQLAEFPCRDFEQLFQGVKGIDWPEMIPQDAWFPLEVISTKSQLESVPACQSVAKKAVVEKMRATYGMSHFPEVGARFAIRVFLVYNHARVFIDTSGEGLHRRGYRTYNAQAPLRETVAAALVQLSHWSVERELYDPMCGSGTILLEAAGIGLRRAAGLDRSFASQRWDFLGRECWQETHAEAQELFLRRTHLRLYGSDVDGQVLKLARQHLAQSGFEGQGVNFQKRDVAEFSSQRKYAVMITNPPYGKRMGTQEEVEALTQTMAEVFSPLHETWSLYFYSAFDGFVQAYGREPERVRKIYNGKIPAYLYQYPGPKPPEIKSGPGGEPPVRKRIRLPHDHSSSARD